MRTPGWAAALLAAILCSCHSTQPEGGADTSAKAVTVREVSAAELKTWLASGRRLALIDVRNDDEWQAGHAASAVHIARWTLAERIGTIAPDKSSLIVLYCLAGRRSAASAEYLQTLGYSNVYSLAGGFRSYIAAGLPVANP
jgi:rhodanese-related sulfurtransferase